MARRKEKEKAIQMRLKGASYSQIKEKLGVPKGTLSAWLQGYPLSKKRIRELRDFSPKRIENYRNTMRLKREVEFESYLKKVKKDIGKFNNRDLFIAGLFLYWAEGGKTERYSVVLSNTDPAMLIFFIKWLKLFKIDSKKIRVKLHLYQDMDIAEQTTFWSKKLKISKNQFIKPYIKRSNLSDITYQTGYGRGTCNVIYHGKDLAYYVHMGLKHLNEIYG